MSVSHAAQATLSHVVEVVEADEPVRATDREVVRQRHQAGHGTHGHGDDGERRRGLPRHLVCLGSRHDPGRKKANVERGRPPRGASKPLGYDTQTFCAHAHETPRIKRPSPFILDSSRHHRSYQVRRSAVKYMSVDANVAGEVTSERARYTGKVTQLTCTARRTLSGCLPRLRHRKHQELGEVRRATTGCRRSRTPGYIRNQQRDVVMMLHNHNQATVIIPCSPHRSFNQVLI